jgi:hypothetical protein
MVTSTAASDVSAGAATASAHLAERCAAAAAGRFDTRIWCPPEQVCSHRAAYVAQSEKSDRLADTRLMNHLNQRGAAASSIEGFAVSSTALKDK